MRATKLFTDHSALSLIKIRSLNEHAPVILITPMQRVDFVYLGDKKNNAWGSYKDKMGQSLARVAAAVDSIGNYEKFKSIGFYTMYHH